MTTATNTPTPTITTTTTSQPHSHGGVPHSHLPATGPTVTWRSLFVLGLAGGLIPSTSALLILLGAIAGGRPAFGVVLVVAFGLGMAAVMTGVGLALILARGRIDGLAADSIARPAPGVAAARGGLPRPRDRPLPDGAGGGGTNDVLTLRAAGLLHSQGECERSGPRVQDTERAASSLESANSSASSGGFPGHGPPGMSRIHLMHACEAEWSRRPAYGTDLLC